MAAELHLAEDALALHLLLKHLEGLVDIVVPDENLHAAFLFDRAIERTNGQEARATGERICTSGCRWHPRSEAADTRIGFPAQPELKTERFEMAFRLFLLSLLSVRNLSNIAHSRVVCSESLPSANCIGTMRK